MQLEMTPLAIIGVLDILTATYNRPASESGGRVDRPDAG
jgi:hypothetical protein